ncbi:MAG: membrane protein of unknown function [Promethearchaeota archaeon]|nr:MAG: membrane protein of unknown function [Candidatus Lokiarchaeota archaeon]
MGFFISFLFISFLGFFSHHWYHKYGLSKGKLAWIFYFGVISIGGLLIFNILLYVGIFNFLVPFLNIFPWISIDSGKDLMWNSFLLVGFDWNINYNDNGLDVIAILLFFSYPMWYMAFKDFSRKFFGGNKPYEKGLWYLLAPTKKPKENRKVELPKK